MFDSRNLFGRLAGALSRASRVAVGERRVRATSYRRVELSGWVPEVEELRGENLLVIRFILPGVKREDMDLSLSGDTLTVSGIRRFDPREPVREYRHPGSAYSYFLRNVDLPASAARSRIDARLDGDVLEVTLSESAEPGSFEHIPIDEPFY